MCSARHSVFITPSEQVKGKSDSHEKNCQYSIQAATMKIVSVFVTFSVLLLQCGAVTKNLVEKPVKPKDSPSDLLAAATGHGNGRRQSYQTSYQSPPQSYSHSYDSGPQYYEVTSRPQSYSHTYNSPPQNYHREYNSGPQSSYHESPLQGSSHRDSYHNEDSDSDSYGTQDDHGGDGGGEGGDDHGGSYDAPEDEH